MRKFSQSKASGWRRYAACAALTLLLSGAVSAPAAAQSPATPETPATEASGPGLELTHSQRELIFESVSRQTHRSTAAPPTFGARLGVTLPPAIELASMPDTILQMVPQTRGYAYAFIADQVLIVEPKARRIVEIITRS